VSQQAFLDQLASLYREGIPCVVVTQVSARGHAPSDPGSKAIVTSDGLCAGTVGGGKVEARAIVVAKERLGGRELAPFLVTWNLQTDIKMTCGGEVTYLFETYHPTAWSIAVFGAGHVAQALVRSLLVLDCRLYCFDARAEWVERLPPATERFHREAVAEPASKVKDLPRGTFFVAMTQGHASDVPILEQVFSLHADSPYIGVIGSDLKGDKIRRELTEKGIAPGLLEKLRCPMGLPIGNNRPEEIAVSITAELLQVRDRTNRPEDEPTYGERS